MTISRAELLTFRGGTLPDLVGPNTRLLFVGINPGLLTVAVQAHFAKRGNRFYPALYRAGITDRVIDAADGFRPEDRAYLLERGLGITSIVPSATARADELTRDELIAGGSALRERVERIRPAVVAVLGITAYRVAFDRPDARVGRQDETWGDAQVWVAPNPSGLNAHESLASLAQAYRAIASAAGLDLYPEPA
ncbi:mismatch-specific DNA-glycosylase [Diaminobutyricibacter sp. McL0618]|uniref:mismatch-specific DNA-glycosylase n=1 Tax=Leifsonia sp. McL0618 TaxID=3415677 RepID=UPI003CF3477C